MPERLGLIAAAAMVAATPAAAQLKPSSPPAVASATVDCWQTIGPAGVDLKALGSRGWTAGKMVAGKKVVDTPLKVYSKPGSNVVLLVVSNASKPNCAVLSRMTSVADVRQAADLLSRSLKAISPDLGVGKSGKGVGYASGQQVALLEGTGSPDKPGIRIIVGYGVSEKK